MDDAKNAHWLMLVGMQAVVMFDVDDIVSEGKGENRKKRVGYVFSRSVGFWWGGKASEW